MSMWDKLKEPFPPEKVSWRVGATNEANKTGLALAYIDARDVMERLDEVCGPDGWQDQYIETAKGRLICKISIRVAGMTDPWVSKSDGAGDTDVEGDKGAISDAFKRAAVKWGIGRYLYDTPSPWVAIEKAGRSWKICASEKKKLADVLKKTAAQSAPPEDFDAPGEARTLIEHLEAAATTDDVSKIMDSSGYVSKSEPTGILARVKKEDASAYDEIVRTAIGRARTLNQAKQKEKAT